MQKILLIGGEGYIGRVVSNYLINKNYFVISYDNLIYLKNKTNYIYNKNSSFKFINGEINDLKYLENIMNCVDSIVILARLVGAPITKKYPDISQKINYDYIKKIIDLVKIKKIHKTIFVSTCSNYGLINSDQIADENFELKPLSLYSKAKVDIEKYILNQKEYTDFKPTILRFATAFGLSERMRFDLTVNEFTANLFLKKTIDVYDQDTWRPYCHVMDFARLINLVIESDISKVSNKVYNAGSNRNNASKADIVNMIQEKIPNTTVNYIKNGNDKRNYKVDFSKVKNELNFLPNYSIEDGIDEIINALKNGFFADYLENKFKYGNYRVYL